MHPGEYFLDDGDVELNAGRSTAQVVVRNTGDRPVQVGSHYHFFEVNSALDFDRRAAYLSLIHISAWRPAAKPPARSFDFTPSHRISNSSPADSPSRSTAGHSRRSALLM